MLAYIEQLCGSFIFHVHSKGHIIKTPMAQKVNMNEGHHLSSAYSGYKKPTHFLQVFGDVKMKPR